MSGLISSIGGLFGGSSAKTDRKNTLAGFGDLSNVFNFGVNSGKSETGASQDLLGQAGAYYSKLLGGDRAATLSAVAPTVNAATAQTDAAKRNIATSGTARGGGVNATGQTLEDQKRAGIDTAVNEAKAGAAGGATRVGGTMASQASNLLGLGETAAANLTDASIASRRDSDKIHQDRAQQAGQFAGQVMDLIFG
jgi:hypothetical protein